VGATVTCPDRKGRPLGQRAEASIHSLAAADWRSRSPEAATPGRPDRPRRQGVRETDCLVPRWYLSAGV